MLFLDNYAIFNLRSLHGKAVRRRFLRIKFAFLFHVCKCVKRLHIEYQIARFSTLRNLLRKLGKQLLSLCKQVRVNFITVFIYFFNGRARQNVMELKIENLLPHRIERFIRILRTV